VITADQMHTQREHARQIAARDAHFVLTIGENQPGLFAAADALCWKSAAVEAWTADRGHGRVDVRTIKAMPATERITELFPHVRQVFLVERYSYGTDGSPLGAVAVLGITSLPPDQAGPGDLLAYPRGHWAIEMHHYIRSPGVLRPSHHVAPGAERRPFATCLSHCGARHRCCSEARPAKTCHMCNSSGCAGGYLIMTQSARIAGTPYLHTIAPPENIRDACFREDASRVSRAHQAKAAIRNTVVGIPHLHRIPNIAAQLRINHRDPYRLPLRLLGLTRPQMPPTGNHAVT